MHSYLGEQDNLQRPLSPHFILRPLIHLHTDDVTCYHGRPDEVRKRREYQKYGRDEQSVYVSVSVEKPGRETNKTSMEINKIHTYYE